MKRGQYLTSIKTRNIASALTSKGFRVRKGRRDHIYYVLWRDGIKTHIWTKISHGKKEYSNNLIGQLRKQLRLDKREFFDLIDCPLSKEGYISLLLEKGENL